MLLVLLIVLGSIGLDSSKPGKLEQLKAFILLLYHLGDFLILLALEQNYLCLYFDLNVRPVFIIFFFTRSCVINKQIAEEQ